MRKKVFYVIPILTLLIFAVSACPSFAAINISGNPSISCSFDSKPNVIVDGKAHTDSSNPSNSVKELTATINSKKNIYFNQVDGFNVGGSFDTQKQIVILMDTSGSLNDPGTTINSPFDYCLFSGSPTSEFYLHGTTFNINGKIHSNQFLRLNAGNFINANKDITDGICEYVTDKSVTGNVPLSYFKKSSVFPMPDLWTKLIDNKTTGFFTYSVNSANWRSAYVDVKNGQMIGQPNIYINYSGSQFELTGGGQFVIPDKTTYYFDGDLKISASLGIKFSGSGMLIVSGKIIAGGKGIETSQISGKEAFVYSCNSDLEIQPSNTNLNGIFYAPKGTITLKGGSVTIAGSVVADKIISEPDTLGVIYQQGEINSIIEPLVPKSNNLKNAQEYVKGLLSNISQPASVGIIKYDKNADANDFTLYDLATNESTLEQKITSIASVDNGLNNLGDALRRAYFMLNNSNPGNKYIIAFTGSKPNVWTVNSSSDFKKDTGNADLTKTDSSTLAKSLDYAKEIALMAKNSNISSYFINCADSKDPSYSANESSLKTLIGSIINKPATDSSINNYYYTNSTISSLSPKLTDKVLSYTTGANEKLSVKVSLKFELPAGTKLNTATALPSWVKFDSTTKIISGSYNTDLSWDSTKKKFVMPVDDKLNNLSINIKYAFPPNAKLKKGKYEGNVDFKNNNVTYEITYTPKVPTGAINGSTPVTYVNSIPLTDLHTHIKYDVDIS